MTFGEWFKQSGLSKVQCARRLGVTRQTIGAWCKGQSAPHYATALIVETFTGKLVPVDSWPANYSEERQLALNFPKADGQIDLFQTPVQEA